MVEIPEELRYQIVSGAYSPTLRALVACRVAEEEAELKLQCVAAPEDFDALMDEAERRATQVASWRSPRTPKVIAIESVVRDVCLGELPVAT